MSKLAGYLKAASLAALIASSNASANDLGVIGATYPVIERDLVEVIQERLRQKMEAGELDDLHQGMVEGAKDYVRRPPGVVLPRAHKYRALEISPQYTLDQDIVDAEGKILFKAGTQVNPLEIKPLTKVLCFVDGDDPEQIRWLQTYCASDIRNKLILVNGDLLAATEKTGLRFYFDQKGYLVKRFGIGAVPAVIRQSGRMLYVEEFPIN